MKKIIVVLAVIITIIGTIATGYSLTKRVNGNGQICLIENPRTIEELIKETPVIITAKVSDNHEIFNYKDEKFHLTKVKVKDLYRDENQLITKNDEITLFQNDFTKIDPLVKKNEELLLFLVKIDAPGYEDVYRTIGLYKGKFKIKDAIYSNDRFSNEKDKEVSIKKSEFDSMIDVIEYSPKHKQGKKTKEELDKEELEEDKNRK